MDTERGGQTHRTNLQMLWSEIHTRCVIERRRQTVGKELYMRLFLLSLHTVLLIVIQT